MMWHNVDGMGWWMIWGGVMMLIFWGGLIGLAVWLVRSLVEPRARSYSTGDGDRAIEIAKQRYARGEITRDEFLQISSDITGTAE